MSGTITDINSVKSRWNISTVSDSGGLYRLVLTSPDGLELSPRDRAMLPPDVNIEYVFDINPRAMEMEEPAAVTIVPTQNGQFVEHQGNIYKNITISGTTGLRPNKGRGTIYQLADTTLGALTAVQQQGFGALGSARSVVATLESQDGLPPLEKSGFEVFLSLRNMFRAYFDIKRDPSLASRISMVWCNGKEGEYYIVEPITFKTKRDASSPVTFSYDLVLRTIGKIDNPESVKLYKPQPLDQIHDFTVAVGKYTRLLNFSLETLLAVPETLVGIAQNTYTAVVTPADELRGNLLNVSKALTSTISTSRQDTSNLAGNSLRLMSSLQASNTTDTLNSVFLEAANAAKNIMRVAAALYSQDSLFSRSSSSKISDYAAAYTNAVTGTPLTAGSPTNLNNISRPSSTALENIGKNDTIFSIALRVLGDQARWKELVILNNLKYPYIDATGDGVNVLRPNDTLIYPSNTAAQRQNSQVTDLTSNTNQLKKRLGRDIKLVENSNSSFDLAVNDRGDLATIEGEENLIQSIKIKFNTEQGSLRTHPEFGVQMPIGQKLTINSITRFQINTRITLLRDSRISNINSLSFVTEGNVLKIGANLSIVGVDNAISISFDSRR